MKILFYLLTLLHLSYAEAEGDWGIEYSYDHPYDQLLLQQSRNSPSPIYTPKYRLSFMNEIVGGFGIRGTVQRDNYYYGLLPDRSAEFNSTARDVGYYYNFDDVLLEMGSSEADTIDWDQGKAGSKRKRHSYFRFGKNRFLKDGLNFICKVSSSQNRATFVEARLLNATYASRPEIKVRADFIKDNLSGKSSKSLNMTIILSF